MNEINDNLQLSEAICSNCKPTRLLFPPIYATIGRSPFFGVSFVL